MHKIRTQLLELAVDQRVPESKIEAALGMIRSGSIPSALGVNGLKNVRGIMDFLGGVSRTKVWKMRKDGMPSYKIGSRVFFDAIECLEWLKSHGQAEQETEVFEE